MLFGFILGVIITTAFILYGNGELLIQLGEHMKQAAERFWAWRRGERK